MKKRALRFTKMFRTYVGCSVILGHFLERRKVTNFFVSSSRAGSARDEMLLMAQNDPETEALRLKSRRCSGCRGERPSGRHASRCSLKPRRRWRKRIHYYLLKLQSCAVRCGRLLNVTPAGRLLRKPSRSDRPEVRGSPRHRRAKAPIPPGPKCRGDPLSKCRPLPWYVQVSCPRTHTA